MGSLALIVFNANDRVRDLYIYPMSNRIRFIDDVAYHFNCLDSAFDDKSDTRWIRG
jgi:hypothetical protein